MNRRILTIILALCLTASLLTGMALAEEPEGGSENAVELTCIVSGEPQTTQYATLTAAAQAAAGITATSRVVKLLQNVEEDVPGDGIGEILLVVDLNGKSFAGSIQKDHDLTVQDTSEDQTGTAHFSYVQCNVLTLAGGTVTIDDASIDHTTKVTGADVTINGGEYRIRNSYTKAIDRESGELTVNGGCFNTKDSLESEENAVVKCTVRRQVKVNEPVKDVTCYVIGKRTQGDRTVQKTPADGETLYFYDLSTAALAAADGDTITLLDDQTIAKKVEVKHSVTIDGADHTIGLADTVKNLPAGPQLYGPGVLEFIGTDKTAKLCNVNFKDITRQNVLIRAYNSGEDSTLTVDGCTFENVNVLNVVRAASESGKNCALRVTNSVFQNCTASCNGVIQIDNNKTQNADTSEIRNNSFIGNRIDPNGNAAVIYLSAPAAVENNYFESNTTKAPDSSKNGIVVTGSNAGGSAIRENAFVSHTFDGGNAQGAVYGAAGATTVDNNYYDGTIAHLAKAADGFAEGKVAARYVRNGTGAAMASESDSSAATTGTVGKKPVADGKADQSRFTDVPSGAYYAEAVDWAVEHEITDGVGGSRFAPDADCTRAQIVTFLWRAAGSPEPETMSRFTDVPSGAYYACAVAWAVETGITRGTSAETFSPDAVCTRAHAVTFLARLLQAKAQGEPSFRDVPADAYYADAVAWALESGVTEGVGDGKFAPDAPCTRGQIVTFLYRAYQ